MMELCVIVSNLLQITEQMSYPRCRLGRGREGRTHGGCWVSGDVRGDNGIGMQEGESRTPPTPPRSWTDTIRRADVFFPHHIRRVVSRH